MRWYIDASESWWSGLSPFLFLFLPPLESSKQQDVARTSDVLHAELHAPAFSELETFKVGRALPSIIDCSTAQDSAWTHTGLLATLLVQNNSVVSALIIFEAHFKIAHNSYKSYYDVLYCIVLYCIVLYCIVLCCVVLCFVVLCCVVFCCVLLCLVEFCCVLLCFDVFWCVLISFVFVRFLFV